MERPETRENIPPGEGHIWLYQFKPTINTLAWLERARSGESIPWDAPRGKRAATVGDLVYLWQAKGPRLKKAESVEQFPPGAGEERGLKGWGYVEQVAEEQLKQQKGPPAGPELRIVFQEVFEKILPFEKVVEELGDLEFGFLKSPTGTVFPVSVEVAQVLNTVIRGYGYVAPDLPDPGPGPDPKPRRRDPEANKTRLRKDTPSATDQLGREELAESLVKMLGQLWQDANGSRGGAAENSLVLQLYGPWGAGKTSFINLMKKHLCATSPVHGEKGWLCVDFNAWRHQHVDPPWWALMEQIFRQGIAQRPESERLSLKFKERCWRLFEGHRVQLGVFAVIFLVGFLGVAFTSSGEAGVFKQSAATVRSFSELLSLVGGVATTLLVGLNSIFAGSAASAKLFQRFASDPMERVGEHFFKVVNEINAPIVVFIDDLDRCRVDFVVRMMESLHTLFNHQRIIYVVAADRRWVSACFEKSYEELGKSVAEPGRPTGHLFLDKIFQLSIRLPGITPDIKATYLERLLEKKPEEAAELADKEVAFKSEFEDFKVKFEAATSLQEVEEALRESTGDQVRDRARMAAAILRTADREFDVQREHRLSRFAHLMEANPRALKLLVNAYGININLARASGVRYMSEDFYDQVALWTILSSRYPAVAEALEHEPDLLPALRDEDPGLPEELVMLIQDKNIANLLDGKGVGRDGDGRAVDKPLDVEVLKVLVNKEAWEEA